MKTRTITAIIALFLAIPFLILGGTPFLLFVEVIAILGLKEFLDIRKTKKNIPLFIEFLAYLMLTFFLFSKGESTTLTYSLDFRLLAGLFLSFLLPVVLYHDKEVYNVVDAFYLIGGVFFLGSSFYLCLLIRSRNLSLFIYLLLVSILTDTYAYFTGRLIGSHKLLESVSPNKTLEGLLGGTFFGTFIPAYYYFIVIGSNISFPTIFLITLFLSLVGQFGDLFFSSMKRYYGKKDFSNLLPGHGGVLDRFDSIIFILLGFAFFMNII